MRLLNRIQEIRSAPYWSTDFDRELRDLLPEIHMALSALDYYYRLQKLPGPVAETAWGMLESELDRQLEEDA